MVTTKTIKLGGKLHLVEGVGKIPLADITLIEDPNEEERTEEQGKAKQNQYLRWR